MDQLAPNQEFFATGNPTPETRDARRERRQQQIAKIMEDTGITDPRIALWKILPKDIRLEYKEKHIEQLQEQTKKDELTGMLKRQAYESDLSRAIGHLEDGTIKGVIVARFDLDKFSWVNEILEAHEFGDMYLQQIGDLLEKAVRRGYDMPYRVGGDEFALLITDSFNIETAKQITERIFDSINGKVIKPTFESLLHSKRKIKYGPNAGKEQHVVAFQEIAQGFLEVTRKDSDKRKAFLNSYKGTQDQKKNFLTQIDSVVHNKKDIFQTLSEGQECSDEFYKQFIKIIEPAFSDLTLTMGAVIVKDQPLHTPIHYDKLADQLTIQNKDMGKSGTLSLITA